MTEPAFIFTVCQVGAEPTLKEEIARTHPELKFAYSRPGFVTFKFTGDSAGVVTPGFELRSIFARAYGLSRKALDPKKVPADQLANEVLNEARALSAARGTPLRLHLVERDRHPVGEEPLGFEAGALAREARRQIEAAAGGRGQLPFLPDARAMEDPLPGETVLDVIVLEPDHWWVGWHEHTPWHSRYPGGRPDIPLPPESPSRAFLKIEEAIRFARLPMRAGDLALEIGSAPGGASYALLCRGLTVWGIDPAEMHPAVFQFGPGRFVHMQQPVASVLREDLPESIQWLLLDMNVAPSQSIFAVDRLASRIDTLLGLVLTVKLNRWEIAREIPGIIEHVREMGHGSMVRVRAAHLASNRQEITLTALTRRGENRLRSSVKNPTT